MKPGRFEQLRNFILSIAITEIFVYIIIRVVFSVTSIKGYTVLSLIGFNVVVILLVYSTKYIHPQTYNKVQEVAPKMDEIKEVMIPPELVKTFELLISLVTPFSEKLITLPGNQIINAIIHAALTQEIPEIPGRFIDDKDLDLLEKSVHYVRLATGIYGSKSTQDIIMNPQLYSYKDIIDEIFRDESTHYASLTYFSNITGINKKDILFTMFSSSPMITKAGAEIHSPPLFIVRDHKTEAIVVVCRGTNSINDALIDVCEEPLVDDCGFIHEGMGMIAMSYIENEEINTVLQNAFEENPEYKLYSVGHSLGAAVAALLCIKWRHLNMYMDHDPHCICFASPPCISKTYTIKGEDFITTFVNEDDIVPRCSADCVHLFAEHSLICSQYDTLEAIDREKIHKLYKENNEKYKPYEVMTANYIIPGTVYYMSDRLNTDKDYEEYEQQKLLLYTKIKELKFSELIRNYNKLKHHPFIKVFKGSEMPRGIRIYPWIVDNHSVISYDDMVNKCLKTLLNQNSPSVTESETPKDNEVIENSDEILTETETETKTQESHNEGKLKEE